MTQSVHLLCTRCGVENRVPSTRLVDRPVCGQCRVGLLPDTPFAVDGDALERHIARDGVPLLVDFWAAWCGPCRTMAPRFEAAAAMLRPRARLAKLDTEAAPETAARLGIRGIPTLILFAGGREVARTSGVMETSAIVEWTTSQLA
jgi:thioredoxin 2